LSVSQTQEEEWKRQEGRAKVSTLMLKTMLELIPKRREYKHGMTPKEVEEGYKFLARHHLIEKVPITTFENRVRDCYNKHKTCGKHLVPTVVVEKGKTKVKDRVHYFPLSLDEKGMVDHSGCVDCERRK